MKIDRRCFLSFGVAGAVGTALSPLPWKLIDDVAIWTQNWPWTPVPAKGPVSHVHSVCSLCPGGCGITVRKVGERAVKIEGRDGYPVNEGGICSLGLSGLQLLYDNTRVRTPLKRLGERGAGHWTPVSWETALADIAEYLGELRDAGQAHTVGCLVDRPQGTVAALFQRFLEAYGSPNYFWLATMEDAWEQAFVNAFGAPSLPGFDLAGADVILSLGSGLLDGWGSPVYNLSVSRKWQCENTRLIQIEPRYSRTAAKAEQWYAVTPGSETLLALGIASVLVVEGLYDREFVDRYSIGFKDYKNKGSQKVGLSTLLQENFTPAMAAEATGLAVDTITELAHTLAAAKHPLVVCGQGAGRQAEDPAEVTAVMMLNALLGNINKPGGLHAVSAACRYDWPRLARDANGVEGLKQPRLDGAGQVPWRDTLQRVDQLASTLLDNPPYPLNALLIHGANPAYSLPDTQTVQAALAKVPLIVSFSSYMDETASLADYILPNHCYLERWEDIPAPAACHLPLVGLARPVVAPQWNTCHAGDTLIRLARKVGDVVAEAFPWKNYQACLESALKGPWDDLIQNGFWYAADHTPPAWKASFQTASKKFEFANEAVESLLIRPAVAAEGDPQTYPLLLVPYDTLRLSNGYIAGSPFLMKILEDTILKGNDSLVEINPLTAEKLGLINGRKAVLSTPYAQVTVRVHLSQGIMPNVVALPRGLGHTAWNDYLAGKGVNFNQLMGPVEEPVFGLNAARSIRANLKG